MRCAVARDPGTSTVKEGLAQMLKGGIIMDVVSAEQARTAEEAGACAVMALERVPADIRRDGGIARMADPKVSRPPAPFTYCLVSMAVQSRCVGWGIHHWSAQAEVQVL